MTAPRGTRRLLTWADRLVLFGLVGLGVALSAIPGSGGRSGLIEVQGTGGFALTAPLDRDGTYEVPGPLGSTVVRIAGGRVSVASSPCPNQICVRMGAIRSPGEALVCVPNHVVVSVVGDEARSTDAVTR